MRNMKTKLAFIIELAAFAAIVMIAEAAGFLDSLASTGLFVGLWACPLVAAALHVLVFCRSTRALGMPITFTAVTLVIVAGLSGGVLAVLAGYPAQGLLFIANLLILCFLIAGRTPSLGKLAIGDSDLAQTFGSVPTAPGSRYKTIPVLEIILGVGTILLAQVTHISKGIGLWAYLPVALWVGLGTVFQIYHLRAHADQRTAASSDQL